MNIEVEPHEVYVGAVADMAAKHLGDFPLTVEMPEWYITPTSKFEDVWSDGRRSFERVGQQWGPDSDGVLVPYWSSGARLWVGDDLWSTYGTGGRPLVEALRQAMRYADELKCDRDALLAAIEPEMGGWA